MSRRHYRIRTLIQSSILLGASLLLAFLFCELVVRQLAPQAIQPRIVRDAGFGIRDNEPNAHVTHSSPGEYVIQISTNADGLRGDKNYQRARSPHSYRIALLGDSFVFGYGCNDDEVVSAVLEKQLNSSSGGSPVEVLNFGVSGFGQAEELILYRNKIRLYHPDSVVLFYFENDIGNNLVAGTFAVGDDGNVRSTNKAYLPGTQIQHWMYDFPPSRWLLLYSQAGYLVRNQLSRLVHHRFLAQAGLNDYRSTTTEGIRLTRALLAELEREVQQDGAQFLFVVIPDPYDSAGTNFPFPRDEWQTLGTGLDAGDFVLWDDYYPKDGHWRPTAHRKVAQALTKVFDREVFALSQSPAGRSSATRTSDPSLPFRAKVERQRKTAKR